MRLDDLRRGELVAYVSRPPAAGRAPLLYLGPRGCDWGLGVFLAADGDLRLESPVYLRRVEAE